MSDGPSDAIVTRLVRRLAAILNQTGLSEIAVERGELKVRVARALTVAAAPAPAAAPAHTAEPAAASSSTESLPAGEVVKSPMVGTVFLQPQPESPPFAKVGDKVEAGQT